MKAYYAPDSLRLVGKAWEVSRKLKQLAEAESKGKKGQALIMLNQRSHRK
ncbi:Z-ring formation inhibitor MciZ, partial [Gorillibacterium massiliense]